MIALPFALTLLLAPQEAAVPAQMSPWAIAPNPRFPASARRQGARRGRASVRCLVQEDGRLTDCQVTAESPSGFSFGATARAAVERAWLTPEAARMILDSDNPVAELTLNFDARRPRPN